MLALLLPLVMGLFWYGLCHYQLVPAYLLPAPKEVWLAGIRYLGGSAEQGPYGGRFVLDFKASALRVFLGFSTAAAIGIPLGVCSGRSSLLHQLLATTINGLRSVPGICWLPLAMIWLGIGIKTTVFLIALASFFPIYLNTFSGTQQVNPLYIQAGAMLGLSKTTIIFAIILPAAMPHIITGLRLGLGLAWAYLVLGELTGVPHGLGAMIMDARMVGQVDIILVGVILIAGIGRLSDYLLVCGLRLFFKSARRLPLP